MEELMLLAADLLPMDDLIEQLEEALREYKATHDPELLGKVSMFCALILAKNGMMNSGKGVLKTIEDFKMARKGMALLKTEKQ